MRFRFVIVPALVAGVLGAGCSLITSYDNYTGGEPQGTDATVDAAPPSPEETLCSPNIPAQPSVSDPLLNSISSTTFYGVVKDLRFFAEDGGCPLGKNLDNLYTCLNDGGPACTSQYTTVKACDGPGGVDNAAAPLLVNVPKDKVDLLSQLSVDLPMQRTGFLLSINGYGGSADLNDPDVAVALYPDVGVAVDGGIDAGTLVDESSISHGMPVYQAGSAWVTNGVLVANFFSQSDTKKVPVHFHVFINNDPTMPSSVVIPLSYATLIGIPVLDPTTGQMTMNDAQLVGRLEVPDLVTSLTALYGCINESSAGLVCTFPDLTSMPRIDGTGSTCDAISVGFGFDLTGTSFAGVAPAVPTTDFCGANDQPIDPDICAPTGTAPPVPDAGSDATTPDASGDDAAL
jgi:hypothetical protein